MNEGYLAFLEERLAPVGGVSIRKMFGGLGIFRDGVMFGLVSKDVLYFRADDASKAAYEAEGSMPWSMADHGRPMTMPYWRVPERLLEDEDDFRAWALAACAAAVRGRAEKPPKKTKTGVRREA